MEIRLYRTEDLPQMAELFRETILTVNLGDYTAEQCGAWAGRWRRILSRDEEFRQTYTLVAEENGQLLGFGNISAEGYLDLLYVHKNWQGRGIATALCDRLEAHVSGEITVDASITAKPFFEKRGYVTLRENSVAVDGVTMRNYTMKLAR